LIIGSVLAYLQLNVFQKDNTPYLDAQVLLADITKKPRSWILAHPEAKLTTQQQERLTQKIDRLKDGMPLPYVLGHWEFYNLDFDINPQVLIPRPETELLVKKAIEWLQGHPDYRRAADIGTGSGCIAVSLADQVKDLEITATDISEPALEVALTNAIKHGVADRITLVHTYLLPPPGEPFHLICANLPYIPQKTLRKLAVFGREPTLALDGGLDGLGVIRELISAAPDYLAPKGILLLEIEASQGKTAIELGIKGFPGAEIILVPDYAGLDRLLIIQT